MALETPAEWLPYLVTRLGNRRPRVGLLRDYVTGNAPPPEAGAKTRKAWIEFQALARTDFGGIACRSHVNRIRYTGVRVGEDSESALAVTARRIARDNRLGMQIADAVWDMASASVGYLVVGADADQALITREKPESFYAEAEPLRPWRARAALKRWTDDVESVEFALVWAGGVWQEFYRAPSAFTVGGWSPTGVAGVSPDGKVPVFIFDRRDGLGLIEPHLGLINRIHRGLLDRIYSGAKQAFRQRMLERADDATPRLPSKDAAGNDIDYSEIFTTDPGALWDLPGGITVKELGQVDLGQLLNASREDIREFAATTGTPINAFLPDSANQSATGALGTTAQQVDACRTDIDRIKLGAVAAMVTALRVEGADPGADTVEIDFDNPQWITLAEKYDAVSKAVGAGMSIQMAQKEILGWTQTQIDEDARNRRRERGLAGAMAALTPAPANAEPSVA